MKFDEWMDEQYGEDTRPDLRRMAGEAWAAGQKALRFDWRSYLLGIGTVIAVIILAAIMVGWGFRAQPESEPMNWTAENVTAEGEAPPIEFVRRDEDATLWRCVCLPPPEEPIALGGVDTGIYGYGTEGAEEMNRIGLVAGGHEFVRCVPLEETR
jgi:hypothetical protein